MDVEKLGVAPSCRFHVTDGVNQMAPWDEIWARLSAFRQHLPEYYEIPERPRADYHGIGVQIRGSRPDGSRPIFASHLRIFGRKVVSVSYATRSRPGRTNYSSDKLLPPYHASHEGGRVDLVPRESAAADDAAGECAPRAIRAAGACDLSAHRNGRCRPVAAYGQSETLGVRSGLTGIYSSSV